MSRSTHQMRQQQKQQLLAQQQQMADNEAAAAAAEMFDLFCVATTMRQILGLHRNMCDLLGLRPAPLNEFYPKLKAKVRSWKAQALWKKFDARAAHRAYAKGTACTGSRVLVIGAGPCGLRTAIEAQLLGAKVLVIEKRDRISRNNVLHLWPFVITDLRNLGAKKFYGKFCAGSIDHISIRQIQCILLKVALLLGVEIHEGVSFERTIEPTGDGCGWHAAVLPVDHAVSHYEFDVLIGADGKRNTLEGFKRKEFRGKLAIAITANFINKKTEDEARVEEISGVAFIFNQSFFKELYQTTGIDLENIVYYKDETHYFVMTAKKHSLIDKGVIMQDFADPAELLAPSNVNTEKLLEYAREAANFSTKYQMPNIEFAVNHYGKPDVAMFDFTSMFAAETSCRVIVRKGFRLLQCLVGDSLLEPFWPTGSGCARGFLSSMDAAYALKLWSNTRNSILGVLAQRESIYRLLNQTTPENLQRDIGSYTVDPATRYPNLNRTSVNVWQVKHLVDTDDKAILEQTFMDTNALQPTQIDTPVRRKRRSGDTTSLNTVLLRWICAQLREYEFTKELKEASDIFTNGKVLCALINRYRPDLVDFNAVKDLSPIECNERAFKILEKELHIPRIMSAKDSIQLNNVDAKLWLSYLEQICEVFRGEVPHVKHPKMDFSDLREKYRINYARTQPDFSKLLQISSSNKQSKSPQDIVDVPQAAQRRSVLTDEHIKRQRALGAAIANANGSGSPHQAQNETPRRAKKRRSAEKAANIEERQQRLKEIEENRQDRQSRRRQQRYLQTQNFYKSLHMLQANTLLRESDDNIPFEDYSIFLYRQEAPEFNDRVKDLERKLLYPDRDRGDIPSAMPRGNADEQFNDRIKSMEQRMATPRATHGVEKKPKDLMRAIGKIESSDWNVREIEKKIEQSRKTEVHGPKGREKVPKWSKEQFQARQKKMAKPARQESVEEKFKEIDQTLKNLDKQLKEGRILEVGERGRNKVASIAGNFVKKDDTNTNSDEKNPSNTVVPKSSSKVALAFKKQAASEKCHFCKLTVYLMEKITAEGLILHRSCLKCHHCHTNLRPGGYAFDRDDPNGRFYCTQHFRLPAKAMPRPAVRKPGQRKSTQQQLQQQQQQQQQQAVSITSSSTNANEQKTPEKLRVHADNVAQLDLLDRGQTPERIEFENTDAMSDGEPSEEHIIDEHEWSGRNFLPESNNDTESDLSSSDESETDSDSEMFEEAADSPIGAQTLQLVTDWIGKQNYSDSDDSDEFYDSSDGIADDGKDDTEGEEFKKARELRREEVRLLPLPTNLPTDTETEQAKLLLNENKENVLSATLEPSSAKNSLSLNNSQKNNVEKISQNSCNSENFFKSANSMPVENNPQKVLVRTSSIVTPTKADIEKLEQNSERKLSAEIDAISEKLFRMNSMVKMNKDLEALAKENLVKSDILKKLTLKEKWLADNNAGVVNTVAPKSKFEEKFEKLMSKPNKVAEKKATTQAEHQKSEDVNVESSNHISSNSNSTKTNAISCSNNNKQNTNASSNLSPTLPQKQTAQSKDLGSLLYNAEHRFSPKPEDRRMSAKMKEIQAQSFAGTMDNIKSQICEPTVSSQAGSNVDLSKYFPNQKNEKPTSTVTNKNQKNLKDIDLAKYFPVSPVPQRRSHVETVADKLRKSKTEKSLAPLTTKQSEDIGKTPIKRQLTDNSAPHLPSLHDHQLDGAVDLTKKITPLKIKTTKVAAMPIKKGGIKIIKKIVPKGIKTKKKFEQNKAAAANKRRLIITQDDSERILNEILDADGQTIRSPSTEYQQLFKEEKSPSDDTSDKIERILEETGIDLDISRKQQHTDKHKKLQKTKSLGEHDFKLTSRELPIQVESLKEASDRTNGVQNILKRFESMSSVKSDVSSNASFKLQRMESTTSNLDKSYESLKSRDSDTLSDLEKTMEYLKTGWRNEATNFLQKKRDNFFGQKRAAAANTNAEVEEKKKSGFENLPIQYRESKIAKFFGLAPKSPEKTLKKKSPEKLFKKSPEKKLEIPLISRKKSKSPKPNKKALETKLKSTPIKPYNSLEELALLSALKTSEKKVENIAPKVKEETNKKVNVEQASEQNVQTQAEIKKKISAEPTNLTKTEYQSNTKEGVAHQLVEPIERAQRVEDIKNLPKTGCDKSFSGSRRGSLASLQSRRLSDISLQEKTETALTQTENIDFNNQVKEINENLNKISAELVDDECDSLCTTISKSPSVAPITVQMRGSSEDESIEKLFSQFSDEMLVDVEFDSNDELIAITPVVDLAKSNTETEEASNVKNVETMQIAEKEIAPKFDGNNCQNFIVNCEEVTDNTQFPMRPKRRQKSTSTSSEKTSSEPSVTPIAPMRLKKKLNRLCPSNMPPSVQDVLNHLNTDESAIYAIPKKFPRTIDESDPETDRSFKQFESKVETTTNKEKKLNTEAQKKDKHTSLVQTTKHLKNDADASPNSSSSLASLKSLGSKTPNEKPSANVSNFSQASSSADIRKTLLSNKALSKEKSLEWDMEKLPNSPIPRKRFVHPERAPYKESKLRDISPTSSIKILNSLSQNSSDSDEVFLRKALIERDKAYETLEKPEIELKTQSREHSLLKKAPTPIATPRSSRASTQDKSSSNRSGTPPMLKKLELPTGTATATPQTTSRRSSFAFIELMDNSNPVIAPMPKKLEVPKLVPKYVPETNEAEHEVFKDRPWPKQSKDLSECCSSPEPTETIICSRTPSPIAEVFKNRQWPDGKTDFSKLQPMEKQATSKSYNDLRRPQTPQREPAKTLHSSAQSLQPNYSTRSSVDNEQKSQLSSLDSSDQNSNATWLATPQRPTTQHAFRPPPTEEMDASTRLLLDRGKRLHNRKRDFMNERVSERNPYMKDLIDEERFERAKSATVEDELDSFRPKHYSRSNAMPRFPTSSNLTGTRNGISPYRDYTSPTTSSSLFTPTIDYGSGIRRSLYGPSLPLGSSLAYQNPPTTSLYGLNSTNYNRRSPLSSQYRDGSYLRDSCVQTETESTSPDEVELNSATEISTDSEFDHDELAREAPKIFIDDTHIRKPTKVQIKTTVIEPTAGNRYGSSLNMHAKGGSYLAKYQVNPPQPQFKPLVQVDPTLLTTTRSPLQNPRPGDYLLNKTASTEGIASKKSLELKKRYLLGEQSNGNKIQKSGSTSVLDSRIRSFQSNISECQKLLNAGTGISPTMKTLVERTKLSENANNDLMRSATTNILNDLKVEITIQKASSTASTDNEKENVFVNSKNELNKGMEYSETINIALLENMNKKSTPTTPTNKEVVIETIDLTTPEKREESDVIDLTTPERKPSILDLSHVEKSNLKNEPELLTADSNKMTDSVCESPLKSECTIVEETCKPDVSKDLKENIPDILDHVARSNVTKSNTGERERLLSNSGDEEKMDSPEKLDENFENDTVQIEVPNISWNTRNKNNISSTTNSSWSTSSSTSIEDIQHYILESTTSPDTNNTNALSVPRVEVHDSTGALMQIDSLMIVDGKYIGDPEDLKYMEIPEGIIVPEAAAVKTTEIDDDTEHDVEPITATPEPAEQTVIEKNVEIELPENGSPLSETVPPNLKLTNLKFDTKNENKIKSLKNLPLIVEQNFEHTKAVKPLTLNLSLQTKPKTKSTPTTPSGDSTKVIRSPTTPLADNDKTPTAELLSRGSDSETEPTGTGQVLTETELSDWTADDCISENFIEAEFVLNSNKGTIKRNKKNKHRNSGSTISKLPSTCEVISELKKTAPVVDMESMFNTIDIDDIEFMDTGSEGSCAEVYSATNTAMLRNRGYMEFIEGTNARIKPQLINQKNEQFAAMSSNTNSANKVIVTKRDEKLGIDYIEQGAYILQETPDLLKTPVNEIFPSPMEHEINCITHQTEHRSSQQPQTSSIMTQSLTDSSTLNELEDDSLGVNTANSQTAGSVTSVTSKPTTTEESEALTVVTSPLDSLLSLKTQDAKKAAIMLQKTSKYNETPSSSDKNPKSSPSNVSSDTSSKSLTSPHRHTEDAQATEHNSNSCSNNAQQRNKDTKNAATLEEQLSYEEYVRALQQKITQISTAGLRDSLDARKQRRKSSKGEAPTMLTAAAAPTTTVIEQTSTQNQFKIPVTNSIETDNITKPETSLCSQSSVTGIESGSNGSTIQIHKVPEIPTLTRKLEEITKERTKQKDLIHDLVMDKLQSKKQLNAEKRLHRSRQRALLTSGINGDYSSGSSLSSTPKLCTPATISDANCASKAHYHVSTAATTTATSPAKYGLSAKDEHVKPKQSTYVAAYVSGKPTTATQITTPATYRTQRPFSVHLDTQQIEQTGICKLNKTSSFSYAIPPVAESPMQNSIMPKSCEKILNSASTENLRSEARARARLKSNSELGLSPEEKMNLLRQRLYADHFASSNKMTPALAQQLPVSREHKMSVSKSVNDLAYMNIIHSHGTMAMNENSHRKSNTVLADFTSDPNLLLSSINSQVNVNPNPTKTKSNRRQKDPERRKSLIQSISSLFHKDKKQKSQDVNNTITGATGAANSAQTERPGTSGSSTTTASGSVDGVLSLFRISPRSKEKSKDKADSLKNSPTKTTTQHERSNSQDCMLDTPKKQISKHNKKPTTATTSTTRTSTAFSSSSPQLYIHRPSYMANASDEQTPPPIPPLPLNYQRSDDESYATETREQKKQRAILKAVRQAELKRLRIAQEIQREQEEIEVQLKELEARGVLIEKALRGEDTNAENLDTTNNVNDEKLLKELLEIWRNITQLKKRDEELGIRQQELQLEHRHAQLKEELNLRLSYSKLDKSSADVAAEGAILNEMLEIVAKRAALRPTVSNADLTKTALDVNPMGASTSTDARNLTSGINADSITLNPRGAATLQENNESNI